LYKSKRQPPSTLKTIWGELGAKATEALEVDKKAAINIRRKVEGESVFCHIKGNRSSADSPCGVSSHRVCDWGLGPHSTEGGRHTPDYLPTETKEQKKWKETLPVFPSIFYFRDLFESPEIRVLLIQVKLFPRSDG